MFVTKLKTLFSTEGVEEVAAAPASAPAVADQRASPRSRVLLKASAYLVEGCADATVRNVSREGIMVETTATLDPSQLVAFSLDERCFYFATVRWCRGGRVGLQLEDALAIFGLVDEKEAGHADHHRMRDKRHAVEIPGRIMLVALPVPVTVRDISQTGMRLEGDLAVETDSRVMIKLRDRPLLFGTVRWTTGPKAGLEISERMAVLKLVYNYE